MPRRAEGFTTIEVVIVLSLFGFLALTVEGMHLTAISAGAAAETSSIAANLARARMETLLALPRGQLQALDNTEQRREIPPRGRTYVIRTSVVSPNPARLDITVTVTWHLAWSTSCAASGPAADCAGTRVAYARALHTRVHLADLQPSLP